MRTSGNTILITGGGSGIGRGLAEAFHKLGNHVIIGGRRRAALEQTAAANPGMDFLILDTASRASIEAAAVEVTAEFPELNVVINNAGVQRVIDFAADQPVDEGAVAKEIDTNILGVIGMVYAFLSHLKRTPAAAIINVSSGLAFVPIARFPVYCATKAFIHSFSMSLRHQLRSTGVRVIELAPPWVATELDVAQGSQATNTGMKPMPLDAFIEAAMVDLASDAEELPVSGAKFLYSAGVNEKAASTFGQLNGW
jgi:uncharacterized oxidoreductase